MKNFSRASIPSAIIFAVVLFVSNANANDVKIENAGIVTIDEIRDVAAVQMDISWKNSWKDMTNNDAVWCFIKFSIDGGDTWKHATLNDTGFDPDEFSAGSGTGLEIFVPADKKGFFLQRYANGSGDVKVTQVEAAWDFGYDGLSDEDLENVGLKIFAIEMVYIPEGAFFAGDNKLSHASFVQGSGALENDPWYIEDEKSISVANVASNGYYYSSAGNPGEATSGSEFLIPVSFSKGYHAIYSMKYEITEGQWVSFFNSLSDAQKTSRDITSTGGKNSDATINRNTIAWEGTGDAVSARPDRACGYLSWADLCAYADWAGLRPMTELEFEKISRGEDITAVSGELPWGNTSIVAAKIIAGNENGTETLSNVSANCVYGDTMFSGGDGGRGPLRSGIFATTTSSKQQAGSGYYGVLEMAGNLWERCVTVGNANGRAYLSSNGDGVLTVNGFADNVDWPGYQGGSGVTGADGSGFRGGSWASTTLNFMAVSNRTRAALSDNSRGNDFGGRCVRTAS